MVKNAKLLFILLLSLLGSGCATIQGSDQKVPVACDVGTCVIEGTPSGAKVMGAGILSVPRAQEATISYSYRDRQHRQVVNSEIRWIDGVLANSFWMYINPYLALTGIAVDWYTGNLFEYKKPKIVRFEMAPQEITPQKIVIAPIQASDQLQSDEAVKYVLENLRKTYPNAKIHVPEEHQSAFDKAGWTFSEPVEKDWKKMELLESLGTPFIVLATVTRDENENSIVTFETKDLIRAKPLSKDVVSYKSRHKNESRLLLWAKSQLINLTPNAISLTHKSYFTSGYSTESSAGAEQDQNALASQYIIKASPGERESSQNDWSLSISNMDPSLGQRFEGIFKLATQLHFRRGTAYVNRSDFSFEVTEGQNFTYSQKLTPVAKIDLTYLGASVGPEIGLAGSMGYIYINILSGVEMISADISDRGNYSDVYSPVSVNLGYQVSATNKIRADIGLSVKSIPEHVSSGLMSKVASVKNRESVITETNFFIGLTYMIPEMRTTGSSFARKIVSK